LATSIGIYDETERFYDDGEKLLPKFSTKFSAYKKLMIDFMNTAEYKKLDIEKPGCFWDYVYNLLVNMGWPKRFILEKLVADMFESNLRRRYREVEEEFEKSAFPEKRRLRVDYTKFNDYLDEGLSKCFRSDGFKQMKLKLN
jgi:hypothetical protein